MDQPNAQLTSLKTTYYKNVKKVNFCGHFLQLGTAALLIIAIPMTAGFLGYRADRLAKFTPYKFLNPSIETEEKKRERLIKKQQYLIVGSVFGGITVLLIILLFVTVGQVVKIERVMGKLVNQYTALKESLLTES